MFFALTGKNNKPFCERGYYMKIMIQVVGLMLILWMTTGCGRYLTLIDEIGKNIQTPNAVPAQQNVAPASDDQSLIINAPSHIHITQIDRDAQITWDLVPGIGEYTIYRTFINPQQANNYEVVGTTTQTTFLVQNAYSSGIHYYAVKSVSGQYKSRMSDYVTYCPW